MKHAARPVGDDDLHAYVDGHLDPVRCVEVEAYLAEHPDAERRVVAYRAQAAAFHVLFDPTLSEMPRPHIRVLEQQLMDRLGDRRGYRLLGRLFGRAPHGRRFAMPRMTVRRLAAAVALVVAGAIGGYAIDASRETDGDPAGSAGLSLRTFAEEAVQAHAFYTGESRFAVEMGAEDRGALDDRLSQRLGKPVFGPDLSSLGYRLIGGRSLPTAGGASAQYMYENEGGRRLTLFVGTSRGRPTAFSFVREADIAMFYWVERSLAYALIGEIGREELAMIAQAVHAQFQRAPPAGNASAGTAPPSMINAPPAPAPAVPQVHQAATGEPKDM